MDTGTGGLWLPRRQKWEDSYKVEAEELELEHERAPSRERLTQGFGTLSDAETLIAAEMGTSEGLLLSWSR